MKNISYGLCVLSLAISGAFAQGKPDAVSTPPGAFAPQPVMKGDSNRETKSSTSSKRSSSSKNRPSEVSVRLHEIVADGKRVNHPLIIRTGKSDSRATDQLREDLAVMSRILDKTAEERGESYHAKAAGIEILALSSGGRFARTLYIEDYGVIFTVNVGIPLRGESKADDNDEKEAVSTEEWEEARNEILGRKRRTARVSGHQPQREFNQEEVNDLRSALIDSLKNATNIRNLKPTDWVSVVVRGAVADFPEGLPADAYADIPSAFPEESTMVLRVKKSDIDKAAGEKGGDLQKSVSVTVY